ncbi:hypothetical protein ES708_27771 [subsurface metagenome]
MFTRSFRSVFLNIPAPMIAPIGIALSATGRQAILKTMLIRSLSLVAPSKAFQLSGSISVLSSAEISLFIFLSSASDK